MKNQRSSIHLSLHEGLEAVIIENGLLRLIIVPELGGKIVSLLRVESGHEFLLQPSQPQQAYRARSFAAEFEDYGPSGFDECVPTVGECAYPVEPFLASRLPDHGDVWCLPTTVEIVGDVVRLTTVLRSLPLRFTRTVQLRENTVRVDYETVNLSRSVVQFLWSAHPLLNVEPEAEIILPPEVREVEVEWSNEERLGKPGDKSSWPKTTDRFGRPCELNRILSASAGTAEKLFTSRLSEGFCGIFLPRANESIVFLFNAGLVPYVGIWICQGGWPESRTHKDFTVALEPCNGRPDSLKEAIVRKECAVLAGSRAIEWWMDIEINSGPPRLRR